MQYSPDLELDQVILDGQWHLEAEDGKANFSNTLISVNILKFSSLSVKTFVVD